MAQALAFLGDRVDSTFSLPLLAQLYDYLQPFAYIFPDLRLFRRFVQAVKGVIAAGVPIISRMATAVLQSRDNREGLQARSSVVHVTHLRSTPRSVAAEAECAFGAGVGENNHAPAKRRGTPPFLGQGAH